MEIWTPKDEDDSLHLKFKDGNEHGKYTVTAFNDGRINWWVYPEKLEEIF